MPEQQQSHYCPSCGSEVVAGDHFCRTCGARIDDAAALATHAPEKREQRATDPGSSEDGTGSPHKRWLIIGGIAAAIVAVAAVVYFTVGNSGTTATQRHENATRAREAEFRALKTRLYGPFETAMGQRTKFFTAEADYLTSMRDVNSKLSKYEGETRTVEQEFKQIENANSALEAACQEPESTVRCPSPTYPTYPDAPNMQSDVASMRSAVSQLAGLNAEVLAVTPQPEIRVFYAQLEAVISSLSSDAEYNANTLVEAITEPKNGGVGTVEERKTATLHGDTGLPSVRLMNKQAVQLIHVLRQEISQYDVPGGTDVNPADHSIAE